MKVNFSNVPWLFSVFRRSGSRPDTRRLAPRASQRGIALIITLIMLSVITFMTVTFLVLSQRERGSVTTNTDQLLAKQAADSALERAKIELIAPMLALTNSQVNDLLVSTNFINRAGFDTGSPVNPYTNVNYDYRLNGSAMSANDRLSMLANLLYNPRPPVFVTNTVTGGTDFRYYLDLNRNGRYDTNGFIPVMNPNGGFYNTNGGQIASITPGNTLSNYFVGDPEWIGVMERPELPYSSSNKFVSRYAYVVVPAGKTLDVNYIHNEAFTRDLNGGGFMRNQGAGSWEINLGAFLTDLNTNQWGTYQYFRPGNANVGQGFDDALSILRYRYAGNYNNLQPASQIFSNNAVSLRTDGSDQYADGPLMTGLQINEGTAQDPVTEHWVGADNPNHFFTPQEFFDRTKITAVTPLTFVDRLRNAGTNTSSYDRYTYYRMLSQLGTDSAPDRRINVNYANVDSLGRVVPGMETNLTPWAPEQFFTLAADRLIRQHTREWSFQDDNSFSNTFGINTAFSLTNIPVFYSYINSGGGTNKYFGYTPSVHRLLQVAANIYDTCGGTEGTNLVVLPPQSGTKTLYAPHVFRPIFRRDTTNTVVYIVGYRELTDTTFITSPPQFVDLNDPVDRAKILIFGAQPTLQNEPMAYGVPIVIGAKKGFPNFNKFALQNGVTATRKLFFQRPAKEAVNQTNQIYSFGISNAFGIQTWNSYNTVFPRPVTIRGTVNIMLLVTNEFGAIGAPSGGLLSNHFSINFSTNVPAGKWAKNDSTSSFLIPLLTNYVFLNNSEYVQASSGGGGSFVKSVPAPVDPANTFNVPKLWLNVRAQVRVAIIDTGGGADRILDYVNLDSSEAPINILDTIRGLTPHCDGSEISDGGDFWCTNRINNPQSKPVADNSFLPTYGIVNQVRVSMGDPNVDPTFWTKFNASTGDKDQAIALFSDRFNGTNLTYISFAAPFQPTRTFYQYIRWEANDPLVHYTASDLTDLLVNHEKIQWEKADQSPLVSLKSLNGRYLPWGGKPINPAETNPKTQWNPTVKDVQVVNSDSWDFPTNKLPNVGWLGRVHRGTPWQTLYLKSSDLGATNGAPLTNSLGWSVDYQVPATTWVKWSGNLSYNNADAFYSRPVRDRLLFDTFTTALSENASHGRLSVNQTGLAAWSAVLSGVNVMTNSGNPIVIEPAAVAPAVARIVQGINDTRSATNARGGNVYPQKQFSHIADVLATPELTFRSPFITTNAINDKMANGLTDAIIERIPQQILGLLDLDPSPRFVIYSYGQTLRPAEQSIIRSFGQFFGMCTNYQVTAETATRAVVRVEGSFDPRDRNNSDPLLRYPPRMVTEQFNVLPPD